MTLVAGIDSSTQSCKIVIRDVDSGDIVRSGRAAHPDGTEIDPSHWWVALCLAISDAGGLADVAAVSVAGQQHGMVVLDAQGRVIRPALLWNDTKSADAALELIDEIGQSELAKRTGSVPVASFTVTKLRWLRDAEPEHAARVAAVALPHDWLTWRLRGFGPADESVNGPVLDELTTDRSDASGTSYWNPATGDYDLDLLDRALRPVNPVGFAGPAGTVGNSGIWVAPLLPRVVPPGAACGITAEIPEFPKEVRAGREGRAVPAGSVVPAGSAVPAGLAVGAGAGDNAAAAFGLGAGVGDVVVSLGTSGTVFAVTDSPLVDVSGAVAGFADATGNFLPLVATLNAARILDATARLLDVDHIELGRLALSAQPGSGGLVLQPYFEGERTPNLPDATATLFGMTLASTTRENLARASIEGMLAALADAITALQRLGVTAQRVLLIGGAAQNPAVQEIAAQVFGLRVDVPEPGEYVAAGAARQAAWALTGTAPAWSTPIARSLAPDTRTVITEQYAARQ